MHGDNSLQNPIGLHVLNGVHVHGESNTKSATNPNLNVGNKPSNEPTIPISYATKLSPTVNMLKANFRKLEASL